MKRRTVARLALAGAILGFATPDATAGSGLEVRPGALVRWPGERIDSCGVGGVTFPPLDGTCFFPVDLQQAPGPLRLVRRVAGREQHAVVTIAKNTYPIQSLTLPPSQVDLSPADAARVERENREVAALWKTAGERSFALPLGAPLDPLPSGGRFGARRIINGQARSPHGGADYGAAEGTPVFAVGDGKVVLVADHFFSGRSVFVDHGDGLVSMYFHLSRVDVATARLVKRGEALGAVGATGRAKGPHLHFGVRWHGARVDPVLLLGDPAALPKVTGAD